MNLLKKNAVRNLLINKFSKIYLSYIEKNINKSMEDNLKRQELLFNKMKIYLKGTKIYDDLNLNEIKNYHDFIKKIPVHSYDFFENYINKTIEGEYNQLFNGKPRYLVYTSGTTNGKNKTIPCSQKMFEYFLKMQTKTMALVCSLGNMKLTEPVLTLSAKKLNERINGLNAIYISEMIMSSAPKFMKSFRYPSSDAVNTEDNIEKLKKIYEETKDVDIRVIGGIPCQVYNAVNEFLKLSGKKYLKEIWPNLSLITYSGTSIENYEYQLNEKIGKPVRCFGVYNATEGPIAIEVPNLIKNKHVYTPFCDLLIYSFTDINNKDSLSCGIDELEEGNEYLINISTMSGLIQYAMKDCVKIITTKPILTFEISGREGTAINITSEKVTHAQLFQTISELQKEINVVIDHFFIYPDTDCEKPKYEWVLFVDDINKINKEDVQIKIDNILMNISEYYKKARIEYDYIDLPNIISIPYKLTTDYYEQGLKRGQVKMKTSFLNKKEFYNFCETSIPELKEYIKIN